MILHENLGEGDSLLIRNILSETLSERCLNIENLEEEIQFQNFYHKGKLAARKVALQGEYITTVDNELDMPLYRTPGDYRQPVLPWSHTINEIREELSNYFQVSFNHVKLQLYQDGNDYITKHSDKTLDIKKGSLIVNLNLGTTRHFTIQNKITNEIHSYEFPHNSVFVLGWRTNINWTHCVNKDPNCKNKRISLVFRQIATWMTPKGLVYGQGGRAKTREMLLPMMLSNNNHDDADADAAKNENYQHYLQEDTQLMLQAFSLENRNVYQGEDLDGYWEHLYGRGFDSTDLSALL